MKVIILELSNHSEVVYNIAGLLSHLDIQFGIIANEKIIAGASSFKCEKLAFNNINACMNLIKHNTKNSILLFTTVQANYYQFINLSQADYNIGIVHNMNSIFYLKNNTSVLFKQKVLNIFRTLFVKNKTKLINSFDRLLVPEKWMAINSKIYKTPIPFSYYDKQVNNNQFNEIIKIGITGTVTNRARDYNSVLQALNIIYSKEAPPIELFLLGESSSKTSQVIVQHFKSISTKIKVFSFCETIPFDKFDSLLSSLSFMIAPVQKSYEMGGVIEYYGKTNITGAQSDMIKHAIPAIWPSHYPLSEELEGITNRYISVNDLSNLLSEWIIDRKFDSFHGGREVVKEKYSTENMGNQLLQTLSF